VAATNYPSQAGAILLAALALPGVALADQPPEQASISLKYLDYKDSQPNLDRVSVHSPALDLMVPIAGVWSLRAGLVSDVISGASPRYHTAVSGASHFHEKRSGADAGVTRYFERATLGVSAGVSTEHDYFSRFVAVNGSVSSDDNNTTWLGGVGATNDRINPVNLIVRDETKHTVDVMLGVNRVLTPTDIVQAVLTHVRGRGYFSNPYKLIDTRPREHDQDSLLLRWNHHFGGADASLRTSYRYTTDSYDVHAHTLSGEYEQPLAGGWAVTPSLRLYTQSAASFYVDPVYDARFGAPIPPNFSFSDGHSVTEDTRLSAYGAVTLGLKLAKQIGKDTTVDIKYEAYEQRASWRQFGDGSPGLQRFSARSIQVGITTRW
jgi:hypothetical protein